MAPDTVFGKVRLQNRPEMPVASRPGAYVAPYDSYSMLRPTSAL
jgi:hypothetical protein